MTQISEWRSACEEAKEAYRARHTGGCRMLEQGPECSCFLCAADDLQPPDNKLGWRVRLKFDVRDVWVGVFWRKIENGFDVFICLVPCLPLSIKYRKWL